MVYLLILIPAFLVILAAFSDSGSGMGTTLALTLQASQVICLCVRQAQLEAQKATQDFQRATEVLRAAKETISLAEQRLLEEDNFCLCSSKVTAPP